MRKRLLITIDGPAGSGKSTVSRMLAKELGYLYFDTGALYRALAYQAMLNGISDADEKGVAAICRGMEIRLGRVENVLKVFVANTDVTEQIRSEEIGLLASSLSALATVRSSLLAVQRESGKEGGVVAEGRDMGSVVFPDADIKFFLDADAGERIRRRQAELVQRGERVDIPSLRESMLARDRQDRERAIAPLRVPEGAIRIDSTGLSIEEVLSVMLAAIRKGE